MERSGGLLYHSPPWPRSRDALPDFQGPLVQQSRCLGVPAGGQTKTLMAEERSGRATSTNTLTDTALISLALKGECPSDQRRPLRRAAPRNRDRGTVPRDAHSDQCLPREVVRLH